LIIQKKKIKNEEKEQEQKQEQKQQENNNNNNNNSRSWQVIYSKTNEFSIQVFTKTRCDKPTEEVEDILYSSLKYEIKQKLVGKLNYPFLLSKIYVVESTTGEIVQKNNKSVLKGTIECAITNSSEKNEEKEISGVLKVQFTDVSYHHKKCDFCWEISIFTPNELNNPILKIRSSSFKVFARKPSQVAATTKKKRKKDEESDFELFCNRLEELVKFTKKLKTEERKTALSLVTTKLLEFEKKLKKLKKEKLL